MILGTSRGHTTALVSWNLKPTPLDAPPADNGYKIKMFDPDAQAVVAVLLGPSFGGPLQQLFMFK
jgi:hypothetical protein